MASLYPQKWALGIRLSSHLLRRCSYNINKDRIRSFSKKKPAQALEELLKEAPAPTVPVPPVRDMATINSWWLHQALLDPTITHKMTFFLHTVFVCDFMCTDFLFSFQQLQLLKKFATGNIKKLAKKICLDNLMIGFLDTKNNNKNKPNENFARELLEIFTIGKGPQIANGDYSTYTEYDVQQISRVFTGFKQDLSPGRHDPETGLYYGKVDLDLHDSGDKVLSDKFDHATIPGRTTKAGAFQEINDVIEAIFAQEETAKNICRKLYRYFVGTNIDSEIEVDVIEPLAQTLIWNDYELKPVLRQLLCSVHFNDQDDYSNRDEIVGSLFKSPVELILGTLSFFQITIPDPESDSENHYEAFYNKGIQQTLFGNSRFFLFMPPHVAGYPAYYQQPDYSYNWFTTGSINARYQLPQMLLTGTRVSEMGGLGGVMLDPIAFISNPKVVSDPSNPYKIVMELLFFLFPEFPEKERFNYFLHTIFLNHMKPSMWTSEWKKYRETGDASEVRIQLSRLFKALIYAPEYQAL